MIQRSAVCLPVRTPVDVDPTVGPAPAVGPAAAWSERNCWQTTQERDVFGVNGCPKRISGY